MKDNTDMKTAFPRMLSIKDAAAATGLPVHLIRTLIRDRKIAFVRSGEKKYWINENSLRRFLEEGETA